MKAVDRPNYSIYDKDPTAVLINGMMELLYLYERLEIAKRLRRGRRAKAAKGRLRRWERAHWVQTGTAYQEAYD